MTDFFRIPFLVTFPHSPALGRSTDFESEFSHMAPNAKSVKDKSKRDPLMFAKPLKRKIKESDDNNNVVLRGVIEKIENIEAALDEKLNGKTEFKIEDEEEYKTFKDKYNG